MWHLALVVMRTLLQINVVANSGSTGHIAEELGRSVITIGWRSYIAYGRWACPSQSQLIRIGTKFDLLCHGFKSVLFDRHGFGSRKATLDLISKIEKIKPDIIHLHNIHGYYLNCKILFEYLSCANIPVVWTLHDCWSFTGHCVHFQNVGCNKWVSGCFVCPNKRDYPATLFYDNSHINYIEKSQLFTSVKCMTIVPVCNWLNDMLSKSYFSSCKRQTIINGIDLDVFKPKDNCDAVRDSLGVGSRYMILAVATVWSRTKGFDDLMSLSSLLPDQSVIVVVGLTAKQIKKLPDNMIGIKRTENIDQLVEMYSTADVFINPTYQDTLPTVNIEALACGTPVITYDTGGSADIIDSVTGVVLRRGDVHSLLEKIVEIREKGKGYYKDKCRQRAFQHFNKLEQLNCYLALYNQLLNKEDDFLYL